MDVIQREKRNVMKITIADEIMEKMPGLCVGIIAVKGVHNQGLNGEIEAFRRRSCTEVNLRLKIEKNLAEKERAFYRKWGGLWDLPPADTVLDKACEEYMTALKEKSSVSAGTGPMAATLDELMGSDVLPVVNPLWDLVRSGMIRFRVPIEIVEMTEDKEELQLAVKGHPMIMRGEAVVADPWMTPEKEAISEDARWAFLLITGTAFNRKTVAAARNELARRIKSAFSCDVESGWLEGAVRSFATEI